MPAAFVGRRSHEADRATREARRVHAHTRVSRVDVDHCGDAGVDYRTESARISVCDVERVYAGRGEAVGIACICRVASRVVLPWPNNESAQSMGGIAILRQVSELNTRKRS